VKKKNCVPVWLRWMKRLPLLKRLSIAKRWRSHAKRKAEMADWICPELKESGE